MRLNEIKKGGVYKTELKVQFRNETEIREVELLVRVADLHREKDIVEIVFVNDVTNTIHYLYPSQLETLT